MINSDVQLFWANNENGDIAIIFDMVEEDRNKKYTCPVCGSDVKPVALEGKTKDGKVAQVSAHFSHYDASKCSNESAIHYWFKNKILLNGDSFIIKTDVENKYKCKEVLIEQFYRTEFGIYRPDITIITECGKSIYFEMNYTNKKKVEDYMDKWLELGNPVVEVDIKMLMDASFNKNTYEFRALFYEGKCFNTKKNDLYYDTVGQFKERICKNNIIDNEIRERIKKLDWFWLETINYKRGETNIEQLVDYIDYAEHDEKDLIFMILSKKRCVPIYEDYINYKVDLFEKLAIDYYGNFQNGVYEEYFIIEKIKEGKKYKNIKYNTIQIKNTYSPELILIFNLIKYTKEEYLIKIYDNINVIIKLIPHYDRFDEILSILKVKYNSVPNSKDLKFFASKNGSSCEISLYAKSNWYYDYYDTKYASIYINKNSVKYEYTIHINKDNKKYFDKIIDMDILDKNNEVKMIKFISETIDKGLVRYNQYLIKKENIEKEKQFELLKKEEREKEEQEKILLEIKQEKITFNNILLKIIQIFEDNKDIIVEYKYNYFVDKLFDNLLYFKDRNNKEFIIYSDYYLHKINCDKRSYYSPYFKQCLYNSKCGIIQISSKIDISDEIYIMNLMNSYKISNKIDMLNYKFPIYFKNPKINLSFRDMGYSTKNLPRYNFLNATQQINNILKEISYIKFKFLNDKKDSNIYYLETTDENINNKIYKALYPMIYLAEKNQNDVLNIKLNIDFTYDVIKQPWLIKEFIEALEKLGIHNVHNII